MTKHGMDVRVRVLERVVFRDLGHATLCWVSDRVENSAGYTHMSVRGRQIGTHQAAYEAFVGPVPQGFGLDHLCHDATACFGGPKCPHRRCCNPEHLTPATPAENSRRAQNALKTQCKHGHPFDAENTRVTKAGKRACITCVRQTSRQWSAKNRAS